MASRGATWLKGLGVVVGVPLSILLVLSAFYRFDFGGGLHLVPRFSFQNFWAELPHHLGWLVPFMLLTAAIVPLRAVQWQATLRKKVPFSERYHWVAIGGFVHNVVPGKLGDLFRAFLLSRTEKLPFAETLGSVAVCKLLELCALMLLAAVSFQGPFGATLSRFAGGMRIAAWICLALVVAMVVLARFAGAWAGRLREKQKWPRLARLLVELEAGFGAARSARKLGWGFVLSLGPVLAPALAYGIGLEALGIHGGIWGGAAVLGAIALGQLTPGLPAGTGIYYFVTSWAARSLGASPEGAAAYAALTHLGTIVTMVVVGGISVWVRRIPWKELRRESREAAEAGRLEVGGGDPAEA